MITTAYKFEANLKDVIRLTEEFKKAKLELAGLTKGTQDYLNKSKQIGIIGKQLNQSTKQLKGAVKPVNELNKSGLNLVNTFKSAAVAIAAAFAFRAIVGGLKSIVTAFKDFEAQMAAVKAISGATSDQFKELEADALRYGKTTVFTATQVAQLQEEFARLGFTTSEIQNATRATLDLAAATGESLSNSAQIAGSTLRAYNMDASLTKEVTDTMAAAFTSSALNLERFTESMKFVAPVARATGFTLQETTAALANLADNGIKGSIAGNSLKNIMLKLGDANSKIAKKIGGPVQGIDELAEAMEKLKEEGFGATEAVDLLDKRSAPAFLALMQNIDGLRDSVQILNEAEGATQRMAAIRLDTLQGDMTLLASASEGLSVALGEEFEVMMRGVVFSLTNFIKSISDSSVALGLIKNSLKLATVALTFFLSRMAVAGITSFATSIGTAVKGLIAYTTAARGATVSTNAFTAAIARNPLGALAVAITTAASAYFLFRKEITETEMQQRRLNSAIRDELTALLELEEGTNKYSISLRDLAAEMDEYRDLVDLEMATESELAELRNLINDQAQNKVRLAVLKDEIAAAKEFKRLREDTLKAEIKVHKEELKANAGNDRMMSSIIKKIIKKKKLIKDNQETLDAAEEEFKFLSDLNQEQFENTELWRKRRLKGEDLYRVKKRKYFEQELKDFRKIESQKTQAHELALREKELKELQWASDYVDINAQMENASEGALEDLQARLENLTKTMGTFDVEAFLAGTTIQKVRVDLSLMKQFVNNLAGALKTGGTPELKKFTEEGIKLRKTKDIAKQYFDIMLSGINDLATREQIKLTADFEILKSDLEKQKNEIDANLKDIDDLIMNASSVRISKTLKDSRKKFDILKNMSDEEFQLTQKTQKEINAMTEEEKVKYHQSLITLLARIGDDELAMSIEVLNAKNLAQAVYNDKFAELVKKGAVEAAAAENEAKRNQFMELDAENAMEVLREQRHEFKLFRDYKMMRELRTQAVQDQLDEIKRLETKAIDEQDRLLDEEKINEEQHADAVLRIKTKAANDGVAVVNKGLDDEVAAQLEALDQIKQYYTAAFDAFSTYMNNRFELQQQKIEETSENEQSRLTDEMNVQLELYEGNAEAQADIREVYDQKMIVLQGKKDEALKKIAKKQFQMQKANDIVMAIINGAVAITTIAKQSGWAAIAGAPLMSALVAAQIAAISAQKFVGAKGGIIPDDRFADGGMVVGPSHAQGGVKFSVGGRVSELEGGEAVINKRSTAMFRSQLSEMNAAGGGIRFASGGITGALQSTATASSNMDMVDLANTIVNGINDKSVTVTESEITSTQENVSVAELTSSIF